MRAHVLAWCSLGELDEPEYHTLSCLSWHLSCMMLTLAVFVQAQERHRGLLLLRPSAAQPDRRFLVYRFTVGKAGASILMKTRSDQRGRAWRGGTLRG
jgi:hypothetical protein